MSSQLYNPTGKKGARIVIQQENSETHDGSRYTMLHSEIIGSTATSIVAITTNSLKNNYMTFGLDVSNAGLWELFEDCVVSGGSALTAYNNNRQSANVCDCVIVANPTVATVGTLLGTHVVGSTTGGTSKSGGSTSGRNEWVLKHDTTYMVRFTAVSNNTIVVQGLYFYEGAVG